MVRERIGVRIPFSGLKVRLFLVTVGAVLLLALAGLLIADRALSHADRTRASVDAVESALLIESFLSVQVKALGVLRGLYMVNGGLDSFEPFVAAMAPHLTGFRRVFVTDSTAVVRNQYGFGADTVSMPIGIDLDTLRRLSTRELAAGARRTGVTQISSSGVLFSGDRGILILEPVIIGGRFAGLIGGTVLSDSLVSSVLRGRDLRHVGVGILASATDTVVTYRASRRGPVEIAGAPVRVPGGGAPWRVEVAVTATNRSIRWILWTVGLATLSALLLGVLRERRAASRIAERSSELERLSTELLRANRAKSEFLANISHELRTPLNAIVGFVDLLRDGVYGELAPRQIGPVERIEASATHLRHLVDQILDLGKMAAGRLEVHVEPVDLRSFVLDVVSEVEPLINERGLHLSIAIGATLPRVRTDPTHLRQILVNLLGNAVKYTPEGGVAVRARLAGMIGHSGNYQAFSADLLRNTPAPNANHPWIALQVADTGIGISPANQERIFDEFEQVNAGPRGDSILRGTGLGLAISRRLARLLGGDITVESDLGKGATFTLWLPVNVADVRGREKASAAAAAESLRAAEQ